MEIDPRLRREMSDLGGTFRPGSSPQCTASSAGSLGRRPTTCLMPRSTRMSVRQMTSTEKSELPRAKDLVQSDAVKDVAAIANTRGRGDRLRDQGVGTRQPPDGRAWASSTIRTSAPSVPLS